MPKVARVAYTVPKSKHMKQGRTMNLRRALGQLLLCIVGLSGAAPGQAGEPVVFDEGSPPTMYADQQGLAQGVYPAIVAGAFARMKVDLVAQARPFKRLITELSAGRAGLGGIIRTAQREQLADFSQPYFIERLRAYARVDGGALPLSGELRGHVVGVIRGWSYGEQFDAARARGDFQVVEFGQDAQGFAMLRAGRIDRMVATELAAQALLTDPRQDPVRAVEGTVMSLGIHLAFSKGMHKTGLLRDFDQAIEQMRRSGELDRIVQAEVAKASRFLAQRHVEH